MKILVCISQVPDTTSKISFDAEGTNLMTSGLQFIINPYDEIALSKALSFKEQYEASVRVFLVGDASTETTLRKALSIGADEAVRIDAKARDAFFVATQLASYLRDDPADLILMGAESIDYNGAEVAPALSEFLGVPCICQAKSIEMEGQKLRVKREADGGSELLEVSLPVVISTAEGVAEPRIPNMRGIMTARAKTITVKQAAEAEERIRFVHYETPPAKSPVKFIDAKDMHELAKTLLKEVKSI